jgi:predicted nucleic-acid-binding Zn-ribbon protein
MTKKILTWKIKLPGCAVKCPKCGWDYYVAEEVAVDSRTARAWLIKEKKVVKKVADTNADNVEVPEV